MDDFFHMRCVSECVSTGYTTVLQAGPLCGKTHRTILQSMALSEDIWYLQIETIQNVMYGISTDKAKQRGSIELAQNGLGKLHVAIITLGRYKIPANTITMIREANRGHGVN